MNRTPAQEQAVNSTSPTILVVAGPGAGKTATTIARINHLLEAGVNPSGIIAITFTNAAAKEIRDRLEAANPERELILGHVGTLHSFALKMLKQHGGKYGYGDRMSMISPESAADLLQSKAQALGCKVRLEELQKIKGKWTQPTGRLNLIDTVIASYYQDLKEASIVDFDILLTEFARLLEEPDFDTKLDQYTHLFVDEVQDSAPVDWEIYLTLPIANKFFVGDPDQAIYGFRGGDLNGMMWLAKRENTEVIKLEQNFRSHQEVCDCAQRLIEHNRERIEKRTVSTKGPGGQVTSRPAALNEGEELAIIANAIKDQPTLDIAVLCRTNAIAYFFQQGLAAAGLPVIARKRSSLPKDWQLARSFVELMGNPNNDTLAQFYLIAKGTTAGQSQPAARQAAHESQRAAKASGKSMNQAVLHLPGVETAASIAEAARTNGISRESCMLMAQIVAQIGPRATPVELALALNSHREAPDLEESQQTGIHCLTIHGAKGREFDAVFLVGWEQEVIPGRNSRDLEEERRLAYVALTRARNFAMVTHCQTRQTSWGALAQHGPSQFIFEMGGNAQ